MTKHKRNLSSMCETCEHNENCLLSCAEICSIPTNILTEIEDARRTYLEAKKYDSNFKRTFC